MKARDSFLPGSWFTLSWGSVYELSSSAFRRRVRWSQYLPTQQVLNFTCNLRNRRQLQPILSYFFFPCKDLQDVFKIELLWIVPLFCQKAASRWVFGVRENRGDIFGVESSHGHLIPPDCYHVCCWTIHLWKDLTGPLTEPVSSRMVSCWVSPESSGIYSVSSWKPLRTEIVPSLWVNCYPAWLAPWENISPFTPLKNLLYSISLLCCHFQLFWTLYLQSSSPGMPSIISWMNQSLVSYSPGSVPSYSPSFLLSGSSSPLAHGHWNSSRLY